MKKQTKKEKNFGPNMVVFFVFWGFDRFQLHEILNYILQGEAHKVFQSDSTQTIDHIQKCFRKKFQWSRRPSYSTTLFFIGGGAEATSRSTQIFLMEQCIFFCDIITDFWNEFSDLQRKVILVTQSMKIVKKTFSFLFISYDTHDNTHR